jgi:hypothetical protein
MHQIDWSNRLIEIKGNRGVGFIEPFLVTTGKKDQAIFLLFHGLFAFIKLSLRLLDSNSTIVELKLGTFLSIVLQKCNPNRTIVELK